MNASTTRWLAGIAVALLLFVVFVDRGRKDTADLADARARVLPDLVPEDVNGLEIQRGTNRLLRLERSAGAWRFTAPLPYPAQPASIERFLESLEGLRWRSTIEAAEVLAQTNGLTAYGLTPPAATITAHQDSRNFELRVGSRTPIGGQVYVQLVGRDNLWTVPDAFLTTLPDSAFDWRDTTLMPISELDFNRLEVRPATNGFEVVRHPTNHTWTMTRPLTTPADTARLDYLLRQLELARIAGFVVDEPGDRLEAFGLAPPLRELVFARGPEEVFHLQVGRAAPDNADFLYLRNARLGNVMLMSRKVLEPWLTTYRDFCDRRLMVFPLNAIRRIAVQADETFAIERGSNSWQLVSPVAAPADPVLVLEMLAQFAELEFIDFEREVATDFTVYGLDPPQRQYQVLGVPDEAPAGATNQVLARLDIGLPKGNLYFARRSLENAVVTMLDNGRLPRAAWELRDRQIWNVSTNQIAAITVRQSGAVKRLVRQGPLDWAPDANTPGGFNPLTIEETAYRLGQLRAERWVARGADRLPLYGFPQAACRIEVELKERPATAQPVLWLGRRSPSGRRYAAVEMPDLGGLVIFELPAPIQTFVEGDLLLAPLP